MGKSTHTINDPQAISLGDLWRGIVRMKLSVLFSMASVFVLYSVFLHDLGASQQQNESAVSLDHLFDLELQPSEHVDKTVSLSDVYFRIPDAVVGDVHLQMMELAEDGMALPVGTATVKVAAQDPHSVMWSRFVKDGLFSFIAPARAAEGFDWAGHAGRRDFYERISASRVVRRYYSDGWILEYRVDERGFAQPNSLRWVSTR